MYSDRIITVLNSIASTYATMTYDSIHKVISRYRNSGAAADSLRVDVVEGTTDEAPKLHITFADHLLILDKGKIEWTRLPDMKDMLAWAATKRSKETEIKQLAFGVAWDKLKNDTWRPKRWRKESLSAVLKEMNERLLKAFDEAIEADLTAATQGGI